MERKNSLGSEQLEKLEELKQCWWNGKQHPEEYREIFRDAKKAGVLKQLLDYLVNETFKEE